YRTGRSDIPILQGQIFSQVGGITERQINYLHITTNGVDATLSYKGSSNDFVYQAGMNINYSKSVYQVAPSWDGLPAGRNLTGQPVDAHIGLRSDGIIRSGSELTGLDQRFGETGIGDLRYVDISGDGKVDENDMTAIGNRFPRIQYGLQLMAGYRGFSVSVWGYGAGGYDIYLN